MTLPAFACTRIRVAVSRLLMALSPRQKRLSAATPSSALQARKKPSNTRGVSPTTPTWERGRFTSFTRRENKRGPQDRLVTRGQPGPEEGNARLRAKPLLHHSRRCSGRTVNPIVWSRQRVREFPVAFACRRPQFQPSGRRRPLFPKAD